MKQSTSGGTRKPKWPLRRIPLSPNGPRFGAGMETDSRMVVPGNRGT